MSPKVVIVILSWRVELRLARYEALQRMCL
jgi:hypothetical protein